jgi:hypothetical protein
MFLYSCTIYISVAHEVKALPVHAMNENAGVIVYLHCLLTMIIGDEWSLSLSLARARAHTHTKSF